MRSRRKLEIIAGQVAADGTITDGDNFSVAKTGTGTYYLTFPSGFRLVSCSATVAGFWYPIITQTYTERSVKVWSSSTLGGGTLADNAFSFIAVGYQK